MSYPESVFNSPKIRKANWLGRYLEVESKASVELQHVLEQAERDISKRLATLGTDTFSDGVRRSQLNLALKSVRERLRETFGSVAHVIRTKQEDAAVAAVDAGLFDERGVLKQLFPNPIDRMNYADSLRQTANRNIEATIMRVLQTEQPLSGRVWKTNALANGLVSKAVNDALARGDSAENLAKEISKLVRPDVPGGISYAAMRLARTEINNAFHAQSINDAQEKPWITQMRWNLSKVHADDPGDACELYAQIGLFNKERVPPKPHPNCRCFVTSDIPDYQEFEDNLVLGHYNEYLDSVMGTGYAEGQAAKAAKYTAVKQPETQPVPQEVAETAVSTRNFDHWNNVEDIAIELNNVYSVDVDSDLGFNDVDMDLKCAKELANQFAVLQAKYPEVHIQRMENIDLLDDTVYAITYPADHGSRIAFNNKFFGNYRDFQQAEYQGTVESVYRKGKTVVEKRKVGFHPVGSDSEPAKSVMTHEWAHALDNWISGYAVEGFELSDVKDALWNECFSVTTGVPKLAGPKERSTWYQWMTDNMSGYSFEEEIIGGSAPFNVSRAEALAEAFDDVERNGDKAMAGSKALYRLMMQKREEALAEQAKRYAYSAAKKVLK